jgi:hypothetical protein
MYVYYIAMKIYVIACISIFSPFYCLCITSMSHTIFLPWISHKLHQNLSKLKSWLPSQFYSMKLYIHTIIYFYQVKVFPKVTNTHLCTNQKEIKQEISYSLHITWLPMWFHIHNKVQRLFTWLSHKLSCESQTLWLNHN